jgi:hypothetical protein
VFELRTGAPVELVSFFAYFTAFLGPVRVADADPMNRYPSVIMPTDVERDWEPERFRSRATEVAVRRSTAASVAWGSARGPPCGGLSHPKWGSPTRCTPLGRDFSPSPRTRPERCSRLKKADSGAASRRCSGAPRLACWGMADRPDPK